MNDDRRNHSYGGYYVVIDKFKGSSRRKSAPFPTLEQANEHALALYKKYDKSLAAKGLRISVRRRGVRHALSRGFYTLEEYEIKDVYDILTIVFEDKDVLLFDKYYPMYEEERDFIKFETAREELDWIMKKERARLKKEVPYWEYNLFSEAAMTGLRMLWEKELEKYWSVC